MKEILVQCVGFQWDDGNAQKNWLKHRVHQTECEEVFFHEPLIVGGDESHSQKQRRYYALGRTAQGRKLTIIFTIRKDLIRVISARDMTKTETQNYEKV